MAAKMNQLLAIEKGVKSEVYGEISKLHAVSQKPELYEGMTRVYEATDSEGEKLPSENKRVQLASGDVLRTIERKLTELMDIESRKDWTNTVANADIVIDGKVLLKAVPVTHLLFLEKQITDIHTFVEKLPTLDPSQEWVMDANTGHYRSAPVQSHRTKKVPKVLVKYEATQHHPAQTEMYNEDVITGYWTTTRHSGAMKAPEKAALLDRVKALQKAVKFAREQGNMTEEVKVDSVGKAVFDYLLPAPTAK